MTFERKEEKRFCHYCGGEGYRQCSFCSNHFCEKHCIYYERHHDGIHFCHLSLRVCINCRKALQQLDIADLLARIEVNQIRYG